MPTTDWERVVESLEKRIDELNTHENNKLLLKKFQKELIVNNYSYARSENG